MLLALQPTDLHKGSRRRGIIPVTFHTVKDPDRLSQNSGPLARTNYRNSSSQLPGLPERAFFGRMASRLPTEGTRTVETPAPRAAAAVVARLKGRIDTVATNKGTTTHNQPITAELRSNLPVIETESPITTPIETSPGSNPALKIPAALPQCPAPKLSHRPAK